MTDAETIAKGLSKTQRKALTNGDFRDNHICAPYGNTERSLKNRELITRGDFVFYRRLTPLGLAVREILLSERKHT